MAAVGAAKDCAGFNAAALEAWGMELQGEAAAKLAFGSVLTAGEAEKAPEKERLVSMGKRQKVRLL